jgi:hypothetical protein
MTIYSESLARELPAVLWARENGTEREKLFLETFLGFTL